jgi:uncharacterized protein (DUF2164 family)
MKARLKLSKEKRGDMLSAIEEYFRVERGEELGDLAQGLILDFFIEKLASEFYNLGVEDAYRYMGERLEDLLAIQI